MNDDQKPLDDCIICGGRGWYKEFRGDAMGMPCWETVKCDCREEEDDADAMD